MTTSADDLVRIMPERLTLPTDRGPRSIDQIGLGGTPHGVVVLIEDTHDLGWRVESMNVLAQHGYESVAVTPDLAGHGWTPIADHLAARGWAAEQTAVLGIGAGGDVALQIALEVQLAAAISVSAHLTSVDAHFGKPLRAPWLGLFGDLDPIALADDTGDLGARLRSTSDVFSQVVRYPGVGADFYRRSSDGLSYAASYDAWQRVLEWLDARVAPRLTPLALAWRERSQAL